MQTQIPARNLPKRSAKKKLPDTYREEQLSHPHDGIICHRLRHHDYPHCLASGFLLYL
jgi:hypothetical protein